MNADMVLIDVIPRSAGVVRVADDRLVVVVADSVVNPITLRLFWTVTADTVRSPLILAAFDTTSDARFSASGIVRLPDMVNSPVIIRFEVRVVPATSRVYAPGTRPIPT
jgi:hypothetical protein